MRTLALILAVSFPLLASAEPQAPKPVKLAAPGFTAVNVDEKVATFFSDHFAQQLALGGLSVISASEIQTLIGFERSKALMGCSDNSQSCLAELGGALGVDGVVTGSIGKFGGTFQANIKVLQAGNAQALSIISRKASSDEQMLNALTEAAQQAATDVFKKLGRAAVAATPPQGQPSKPSQEPVSPMPRARPANVLSWWAGGLVAGYWGIEYERALGSSFSIALVPMASYAESGGIGVVDLELELGGRWYVAGTAPEGFFAGPSARLAAFGTSNGYGWQAIAPGLTGGYTLIWGPLALSAGLGFFYYFGLPAGVMPLRIAVHANVGFAF